MTGRLRVGLWGHVNSYVNPGNRFDLFLENVQMRCANHVFAYTPGGSEYAIKKGINPDKVTTVMNTVDTVNLENCLNELDGQSIRDFTRKYGLHPERTLCFLGGIDDTKRISFLAEMLDVLWKLDPTVKMVVGGRGPDNVKLGKSYARGQSIELGYVGTREKALILSSSRAICMPGRIGLIAVDALITKKPIITTDWMFHAPESDYLVEGISKRTAPNSPDAYARNILDFLSREDMVPRDHSGWQYPTITRMVENYAAGVEKMFN
jgi:glycosyltransferase involved in cell wall biosynthesis